MTRIHLVALAGVVRLYAWRTAMLLQPMRRAVRRRIAGGRA